MICVVVSLDNEYFLCGGLDCVVYFYIMEIGKVFIFVFWLILIIEMLLFIVFDVFFFIILNRNVILIFIEVDLFIWYFNFRNVVFDVYLGCFIGG